MSGVSHVCQFKSGNKWSLIYLNGLILPVGYFTNGKLNIKSVKSLASYIDHTILKATTTYIEIEKICKEAVKYEFAAVCIPPSLITDAVGKVTNGVKIATVIGFPLGYSTFKAKAAEVEQAIADGADELDIVINLTHLKTGRWRPMETEMAALTAQAHAAGRLVKVIIESGMLTDDEIIRCCNLYAGIGVDFLKTSSGYAEKGASVAAVQLMRQHLPAEVKIKASGGIRSVTLAKELIRAGADRLGCSASVQIIMEEQQHV